MKTKILYVEDDTTLSFVTQDHLEIAGYQVTHCHDGLEALDQFKNDNFDLCIVDVMLPHFDGFELAKEIRKRDKEIPILFLTAKSMKEDRIEGLKIGGDDYITKPFSIEELMLRMKVFLRRRYLHSQNQDEVYQIGQYSFDFQNLQLYIDDENISMTQREAELLKLFTENINKVLKRSDILLQLWGDDDYFLGRSLDVFISRLRKYLKSDPRIKIENVHGVGFKFIC